MARRKAQNKKKNPRQTAFTRFMLIVAVLILWIGGIGVRLVYLQVKQHEWLRERALGQRQDVKRTRLLRGTIFDRDDRALAMSINVKTLYADPAEIEDVERTGKDIGKALKIDSNPVIKQLKAAKQAGKRYVSIAKKLDGSIVEKVNKALNDPEIKKPDLPAYAGLHWMDDQKRSYPYNALAAHLIGFSNADDIGQAGIEKSQDVMLHGAVIKKLQERDRLGRVYDETVFEREPPKDIVLTISTALQFKTEQALERGVKAANAKSGTAIVIDQKTGEILALANYPAYSPERFNEAGAESLTDKAIQAVYSPGSVFKLVTYSAALEKKLITPDAEIDAGNGTIEVAKHKFTDSHHVGQVTYAQALAHSSNVCAIKTGLRVGKADFYSLVQKFGFGRKTGVELPAETGGIVRPPEKWNGDSLASMSIGYEIGVTALQMATAFATIANDGVKVQPHLIKEIRQQDGSVLSVAQPEQTQVVTAETARSLRRMLRQVVLTGTGRRAQLDGYTSAGKTGTAWKFDPKTRRVESSKYVSSFIGFAPAENPAVTIAVVMDEPQGGARDGGAVSAPVFREIAETILPELNVPRDSASRDDSVTAENVPEAAPADINITGVSAVINPDAGVAKSRLPEGEDLKARPAERPKERTKSSAVGPPDKTAAIDPKKGIKNKSSTQKAREKT
jgi:cell division protein FtsI (penicillin-binding protein 3)